MIDRININPSIDKMYIGKSDAEVDDSNQVGINLAAPIYSFAPPNAIYAMAYGGGKEAIGKATDVEVRLQRLEDSQKLIRRGRVIVNVPQFRSQSVISQTSANNPFVPHTIGGVSFTSGNVPDNVAPSINSNIRYPNNPDLT